MSDRLPPPSFYRDPALFERLHERVMLRGWHWVADAADLAVPGACQPVLLGEEPLLLVRDEQGTTRCLSNVCTHRGAIVREHAGTAKVLRCRYHGRRYGLDGRFLSMPGFEGVADFPAESDHLRSLSLQRWGPLLFAAVEPAHPFAELVAELDARLSFLPLESARFDATRSADYQVGAHWALYCENYLEGFHIPTVHPELADALDLSAYRTEVFPRASLQVGVAPATEDAVFDLPAAHPDAGTRIAGYYAFLFPSTMLNVYPWGLSLNVVRPVSPRHTVVSFRSYVWDAGRLAGGAGAGLDLVEQQDEAIVGSVQRGMGSRIYGGGRCSPRWEAGVQHFHRLLRELLADG